MDFYNDSFISIDTSRYGPALRFQRGLARECRAEYQHIEPRNWDARQINLRAYFPSRHSLADFHDFYSTATFRPRAPVASLSGFDMFYDSPLTWSHPPRPPEGYGLECHFDEEETEDPWSSSPAQFPRYVDQERRPRFRRGQTRRPFPFFADVDGVNSCPFPTSRDFNTKSRSPSPASDGPIRPDSVEEPDDDDPRCSATFRGPTGGFVPSTEGRQPCPFHRRNSYPSPRSTASVSLGGRIYTISSSSSSPKPVSPRASSPALAYPNPIATSSRSNSPSSTPSRRPSSPSPLKDKQYPADASVRLDAASGSCVKSIDMDSKSVVNRRRVQRKLRKDLKWVDQKLVRLKERRRHLQVREDMLREKGEWVEIADNESDEELPEDDWRAVWPGVLSV
ncbi:MAG: hypothetical protein Q9190_006628 [Brigantiaea leucoxantha]